MDSGDAATRLKPVPAEAPGPERERYRQAVAAGMAEIRSGALDRALETFRGALALAPGNADLHAYVACLLSATGHHAEALDFLLAGQNRHPDMPLYRDANFRLRQRQAIARRCPPILLNTQFKSGSMFMARRLTAALNLPVCYITRTPLDNGIVPEWAALFARGGCLAQEHLAPDTDTLAHLKRAGITRMLVNIRDPRQSMISAIHHYAKLCGKESADAVLTRARLPRGYESWDMERRADHYIATELGPQIAWIAFWLDAARAADPALSLLLNRFEDFAADNAAFFRKVTDFFRLAPELVDWPLLEKPPVAGELHFRAGQTGEWRDILNPPQARAAARLIPPTVAAYLDTGITAAT